MRLDQCCRRSGRRCRESGGLTHPPLPRPDAIFRPTIEAIRGSITHWLDYSASFIRDPRTTFAGLNGRCELSGGFPIGCLSSSSNFRRRFGSARTFVVS